MLSNREALRTAVGIGWLLLGVAWSVRAQNPSAPVAPPPAIVSGVVVDSAGVPIPHAVFSVVGESLRVVTDSQGRFRLAVPPGPRLIAVRALGYRPLMWAVTLGSGLEASGRIRLQRLSIALPEITVVGERYVPGRLAGYYQRRQTGLGKYIDSATIARRFPSRTADLLQGIAGVRVLQGHDPFTPSVGFVRCSDILTFRPQASPCLLDPNCGVHPGVKSEQGVAVYVDGFRVLGDPGDILGTINPADVEAIEVYRGPAELPAEFNSDDCAAIVIWTKY